MYYKDLAHINGGQKFPRSAVGKLGDPQEPVVFQYEPKDQRSRKTDGISSSRNVGSFKTQEEPVLFFPHLKAGKCWCSRF